MLLKKMSNVVLVSLLVLVAGSSVVSANTIGNAGFEVETVYTNGTLMPENVSYRYLSNAYSINPTGILWQAQATKNNGSRVMNYVAAATNEAYEGDQTVLITCHTTSTVGSLARVFQSAGVSSLQAGESLQVTFAAGYLPVVGGAAEVAGDLKVAFGPGNPSNPYDWAASMAVAQTFSSATLTANWQELTATFTNNTGDELNTAGYYVSFVSEATGVTSNVMLDSVDVQVVPEPASMLLLGVGSLIIGIKKRRK